MKLLNFIVKSDIWKGNVILFYEASICAKLIVPCDAPFIVPFFTQQERIRSSSITERNRSHPVLFIRYSACSRAFYAKSCIFLLHHQLFTITDSAIIHDNSDFWRYSKNASKNPYYTLSAQQKKQRQLLVAGINIAAYGGSLFVLHSAWYKDYARTSFQTFNDSKEWLQVDKIGHAWTAYNTGRASTMLCGNGQACHIKKQYGSVGLAALFTSPVLNF